MTIVVSWISKEREFPTLWTVADSRLSKPLKIGEEQLPLLDCGSKLFSIRVVCTKPDDWGQHYSNNIYYSTTIGMSFAGSSLLALNLYAFISYTLSVLSSRENYRPLMKKIAEHVNTAFQTLLHSYIDTNMNSTPCEVSLFGYCPIEKKHQLFHMRHKAEDKLVSFNEVEFFGDDSIHLMGNHQEEIRQSILSEREYILSSSGTGSNFWRSPKGTIEKIIKKQTYPDIGGEIQLGINYPAGFFLTPIFDMNPFGKYFSGENKSRLIYQGIDLYSDRSLTNIGGCHVNTSSLPKEKS